MREARVEVTVECGEPVDSSTPTGRTSQHTQTPVKQTRILESQGPPLAESGDKLPGGMCDAVKTGSMKATGDHTQDASSQTISIDEEVNDHCNMNSENQDKLNPTNSIGDTTIKPKEIDSRDNPGKRNDRDNPKTPMSEGTPVRIGTKRRATSLDTHKRNTSKNSNERVWRPEQATGIQGNQAPTTNNGKVLGTGTNNPGTTRIRTTSRPTTRIQPPPPLGRYARGKRGSVTK